jgi:Tfp pilus assembly protein PilN
MLEEKIRKNRDLFDGAEPSQGHFDSFQSKLGSLHEELPRVKPWYSGKTFRVAAVIIGLLGISLVWYLLDPSMDTNRVAAGTLPQEIQEARMYYDKLADEKLQKINNCAASTSEASYIQKLVENEITLLDSSSVKLEQELQNDKENKHLINALIRNYKTKSDLLDDVLNRLCHI